MSVLTLSGHALAIPLYVSSCVAHKEGLFGVEGDYAVEDPLTEFLRDNPGEAPTDWWNTGKEAWSEVDDYVTAWRRYEAGKRVSLNPFSLLSYLDGPYKHPNLLKVRKHLKVYLT